MIYGLSEHRHRFAVWAAARASQRGFTITENLRDALEGTGIQTELSNSEFFQTRATEFELLHRRWCSSICSLLSQRQIANARYGRAAKLIAVYLKAIVIMGSGADTPLGHCIHPPIDRILLQKLATSPRIEPTHKATWRKICWTQLDEPKHYELIAQLREHFPSDLPFWMLEEYWTPTNDDA